VFLPAVDDLTHPDRRHRLPSATLIRRTRPSRNADRAVDRSPLRIRRSIASHVQPTRTLRDDEEMCG